MAQVKLGQPVNRRLGDLLVADGLITPEQGLAVFEFAVYDSKIRKRQLYEQRLAGVK